MRFTKYVQDNIFKDYSDWGMYGRDKKYVEIFREGFEWKKQFGRSRFRLGRYYVGS
jgi:hypothetical protein